MIEEIRNIKSGKKELRNFGFTIGLILCFIVALDTVEITPFKGNFRVR